MSSCTPLSGWCVLIIALLIGAFLLKQGHRFYYVDAFLLIQDVAVFFSTLMALVFLFWFILVMRLIISRRSGRKEFLTRVTVLVPAHNEERNIARCVNSILSSGYPSELLEVIVIDDHSTDRTAEAARSVGALVLTSEGRGKVHALNTGLSHANGDVVVVVDADTFVDPGAIQSLVAPFSDPSVGAVLGRVRAEGRGILAAFQSVEYAYVSTLFRAHAHADIPPPFIFGAFMAFRRRALEEVGGFQEGTQGEDIDTYLAVLEAGYRSESSDASASTVVPTKFSTLMEQRLRWIGAGFQVFLKHFSRKKPLAVSYALAMFVFWPVQAVFTFPYNLAVFFKYFSLRSALPYVFYWLTYFGPIHSTIMAPVWGLTYPLFLGIGIGYLSMFLVFSSVLLERDLYERLLALLFYPAYATFLLGFFGFVSMLLLPVLLRRRVFLRTGERPE